MKNQQLTEMDQSPNGTPADAGEQDMMTGSTTPTLSRAQEWSAFYESFDALVRDNIQRSNDLLRQATELPEVADRAVAHVRAEMESRIAAEQSQHTSMLTTLQAEVKTGHQQLEALTQSLTEVRSHFARLAERIEAELAQVGTEQTQMAPSVATVDEVDEAPGINGTASATFDEPLTAESSDETLEPSIASMTDEPVESPPSSESESSSAAKVEIDPEPEPEVEPAFAEASEAQIPTPESVTASEVEPTAEEPFETAGEYDMTGETAQDVSDNEGAAAGMDANHDAANVVPFTGTEEAEASAEESQVAPAEELVGSHIVMLLVSGVRRLPLVIQLQRHLAGFDEVERVRLRDFVAGVVRFEVAARRPIELADVHAWCAGASLEITSMKGTDIEVRLTEATSA